MDLSKDVLDSLSLGHSNGSIDDELFAKIIEFTCASLTATTPNKTTENKHFTALFGITWEYFQQQTPLQSTTPTFNPQTRFYIALSTCLTEASRFDISSNELKAVLDDKIDEERVTQIITAFQSNNQKVRTQLALHGVNFSQLVDFHWRLDYNVHSNALEDMREQTYILTFVIVDEKTNQQKEIICQADIAQMNDLLGLVKNAIAKKV